MDEADGVDLLIAIGGVALFIAALAFVGLQYGVNGAAIAQNGRLALLGTIVVFIVVMAVGGLYLAERD
jgi:uncharacterized membrane protein YqjE